MPYRKCAIYVLISLARVMLFRENGVENDSLSIQVLISLARVMLFRAGLLVFAFILGYFVLISLARVMLFRDEQG